MAEITLYISDQSETCTRIKHLLDSRGFDYTTVDVMTEADRAELLKRTGRQQCPLVVVGDEVVGGFRETVEAEQSGRRAALAAA